MLLPVFDTLENLEHNNVNFTDYPEHNNDDILQAAGFLKSYTGSKATFNAYRREIERLLLWNSFIAHKTLSQLKKDDIEAFIRFCQAPPKAWIGTSKPPRFIDKDGKRRPNSNWRPFVATISKAKTRKGETPDPKQFNLSQNAIREVFAILSSFFNYLLQEEYTSINPVALIRQKSQFIRRYQGQAKIRRLTELQWQYVIKTVTQLADEDPDRYERHLFIMSALYGMYLRISELAASERWQPSMNDFAADSDGHWWFTTVGKGNKERQIAVSEAMLDALKRWRLHLGLSQLPSPADDSPLLPKQKGHGAIKSINYIRELVQACFDAAIWQLKADGFSEEAETLVEATVHWLRHTGISDDVKHRPREHVRDDAGHSSGAITDRYIDIERRARHQSARKKIISEDD